MTNEQRRNRMIRACLLFGIGLGGFFDGIVFHQILLWHHMLSNEGGHPTTTVPGLESNTLWDGLFHSLTYVVVVIALWMLWTAGSGYSGRWPAGLLVGLLLMGWGTFNLVEGVNNHHLLGLHHVREDTGNKAPWDIGFLIWGGLMLLIGWKLAKDGDEAIGDSNPERLPRNTK